MFSAPAVSAGTLDRWLVQAERDPQLLLDRREPHPAGIWLGFGAAGLGVLAAQVEALPGRHTLGWLSLAGIGAAMLMHAAWTRAEGGWRIDFTGRRIEPLGTPRHGEAAEAIAGDGWSVQLAPGERRAQLAIDLRHDDRGRVARLLDVPARRGAHQARLSRLADLLARRLGVERRGPQL